MEQLNEVEYNHGYDLYNRGDISTINFSIGSDSIDNVNNCFSEIDFKKLYFENNSREIQNINSQSTSNAFVIFGKTGSGQSYHVSILNLNQLGEIEGIKKLLKVIPSKEFNERLTDFIYRVKNEEIRWDRVTDLDEDAICFVFRKDNYTLYLEIYNDGELGYIIENHIEKEIIDNEDLPNVTAAIQRLRLFLFNEVS